MIYVILIFVIVVVSILLIVVILLQSGRGGGLAGSLGGGVSTAMFGGQGADKLMTRVTAGLAAAFMVLAIFISILGRPSDIVQSSIVRERSLQRDRANLQPLTEMELPVAPSQLELPLQEQ